MLKHPSFPLHLEVIVSFYHVLKKVIGVYSIQQIKA
jgi:hypothetical protein